MLTAKSLAESDCGAAEQRNQAAAFLASANELATVLATLETKHGFEPPTAPGLRFCTRGRASFTGYLAWPRGAKDKGGWHSPVVRCWGAYVKTFHVDRLHPVQQDPRGV